MSGWVIFFLKLDAVLPPKPLAAPRFVLESDDFLRWIKYWKWNRETNKQTKGNSINFIECENFKHLEQYIVCSQMLAAISIIIIITIFLACFLAQT